MKERLLVQRESYLPHRGRFEKISSFYLKILALAFNGFFFIGFVRTLSKTLNMIYGHYRRLLISYKNKLISNNKNILFTSAEEIHYALDAESHKMSLKLLTPMAQAVSNGFIAKYSNGREGI